MRVTIPVLLVAACLSFGGVADARDPWDVSGSYTLTGKFGWFGDKLVTKLTLTRVDSHNYTVIRTVTWKGTDYTTGELHGTGKIEDVGKKDLRLKCRWDAVAGASNRLADILEGGGALTHEGLKGRYKIKKRGNKISGWIDTPKDGGVKNVHESGRPDVDASTAGQDKAKPVSDRVKLKGLEAGVYLAGQRLAFEVEPADAALEVLAGPADVDDGQLRFTGPGAVRVQAQAGDEGSPIVNLQAIDAEVVEITVLKVLPIVDAAPPHFARKVGQENEAAWQPALLLQNQKLELKLVVAAAQSLSQAIRVTVTGHGDDNLRFTGEATLQNLARGQTITLTSLDVLSETVGVHQIEIDWRVGTSDDRGEDREIGTTGLRLYTSFKAPVDNPMPRYAPGVRQGQPLKTKLHFDLACAWAQGKSKNVGDGDTSICLKVDNMFRHLVHWKDLGRSHKYAPKVPHYPKGAKPPVNYDSLGGSVTQGERSNASLYYPPLDPSKDWQEYKHYRNNFGWWVVENDKYAGGRCNQQASFVCDIFGTLGIKAEVYYIERVGRGPVSGRAMRRYYKSSRSSKSWNFHGQAKAILADGSEWLYDGSGSWPNTRINGRVDELMKVPNGPYIGKWNPWRYEDGARQYVPVNDRPTTWRGVPLQPGETPP